MKDHCDQLKECFTAHTEYTKGLPPSLLQHGSFTLLRALWNYLSEIQSTVDMINDITIMDDGNFENVKNIQKVVLELAKILILLKDDNKREEVMAKLEGLHVREQTGSELEDEIDLNVLGRVISNQRKLENQLEEMVNSCRNELQDLATSAGGIIQSMNDLPEILEKITIKVQTDQTVESSLLDRHYPSRREEILIRHCIRPQLSDIPKLITDQCKFEELLLKGLIETTRSISGQKEEFQRRTDYFTSECLSIEKLERTEYQQALQHGR